MANVNFRDSWTTAAPAACEFIHNQSVIVRSVSVRPALSSPAISELTILRRLVSPSPLVHARLPGSINSISISSMSVIRGDSSHIARLVRASAFALPRQLFTSNHSRVKSVLMNFVAEVQDCDRLTNYTYSEDDYNNTRLSSYFCHSWAHSMGP